MMKPSRASRRASLQTLGAGLLASALPASAQSARPKRRRDGGRRREGGKSTSHVGGLTAPKLDRVRLGFIGVGARGGGHVQRMLQLEGVDVRGICDPHQPSADRWAAAAREAGHEVSVHAGGNHDYRNMLERDDLDAVLISTPWRWHAAMAVESMLAGKHAFVEVPMALTAEECWEIVRTSESTRRHCMMMENVCYGRDELMLLNMCRAGLFGELIHGEAAYIHDLRAQMQQVARGTGSWRTNHHAKRNGNLYPTHGLGPVAQYMNIERGEDRFESLVSMSTQALGRGEYAAETFPPDHLRNKTRYVCGDMNTSLIQTARGRTIMVQHDTTSPRPYTRHNLIQGTEGTFGGFSSRIHVEGRTEEHRWDRGEGLEPWREEFEHPLWTRMGELAKSVGGHGGMDFIMSWRMIHCLREGLPLDQNVYEGCAWSVVSALSEASVAAGSAPVDFPDFTGGAWEEIAPLGIVG
jgi:predicted dehydrogenase